MRLKLIAVVIITILIIHYTISEPLAFIGNLVVTTYKSAINNCFFIIIKTLTHKIHLQ